MIQIMIQYICTQSLEKPHLINQAELNYLVYDICPDNKDGIFKQKHKLLPFCNWEKHVPNSFSMNGDIFYCNSVDELMRALGHKSKPENWQLFIDS